MDKNENIDSTARKANAAIKFMLSDWLDTELQNHRPVPLLQNGNGILPCSESTEKIQGCLMHKLSLTTVTTASQPPDISMQPGE